MARPRADAIPKEPHSVSLKVLRLSRPVLAQAQPLPYGGDDDDDDAFVPIVASASLAYAGARDASFALAANLSLPTSFGSAHVGETLSCALCANIEPAESAAARVAGNVAIVAEMQSPSAAFPLQLHDGGDDDATAPGTTLQRIVHFDLTEEGPHVLAVNVSYTETEPSSSTSTTTRPRSFRKLYQFEARPVLAVRTKATPLAGRRYVLEAQLENVGAAAAIALSRADLVAHAPFVSCATPPRATPSPAILLQPRDVHQLHFLLRQHDPVTTTTDGRAILGHLRIEWRGPMGSKGGLTTGALMTRKR